MNNIILVLDSYPQGIGGMETHGDAFSRYLSAQSSTYKLRGLVAFASVETAVLSNRDGVLPDLLPEAALHDARLLTDYLRARQFAEGDILFFNSLYWVRLLPELRRTFPHSFFVQRSGGNDFVQAPILDRGATLRERRRYLVQTANNALDLLIVTSEYSKRRIARLGVRANLMRAIVGGVALEHFNPATRNERREIRARLLLPASVPLILDVARLVPFKGIEYALQALALLKTNPRLRFHYAVVGEGPERARLETMVRNLGLERDVSFLGAHAVSSMHEYYRAADVFCHTALRDRQHVPGGSYIHTESMGRCLIEASAAGLPIVATRAGGIGEVVTHGGNGLLVPSRDPGALARTLAHVLADARTRRALGARGFSRAQSWSWEKVFESYFALFDRMHSV